MPDPSVELTLLAVTMLVLAYVVLTIIPTRIDGWLWEYRKPDQSVLLPPLPAVPTQEKGDPRA